MTGVTPEQAAAALSTPVSAFGFDWMTDREIRARGKSELGLRGRPLYHVGRAGVLGDVPVEIVAAAEAFFPLPAVRDAWLSGRELVAPAVAARWYAARCGEAGRERFPDDLVTARLAGLVERVVDGTSAAGLPLFAGWRALPRPAEVRARLALLLNVLREHRGGVHAAAVAAVGLDPLEAIVAGPNGADGARFFEWPEPYPDPAPLAAARAEAERLTDLAAARPYAVLTEGGREEVVDLVARLLPA